MKNSILVQKSNELDAFLLDLITRDVNNAISALRIALVRAAETLGVNAYYMKPLLNDLYIEVKYLTEESS